MSQAARTQEKQGWDTRAWRIGLIFSNLCGIVLAVSAVLEKATFTRGAANPHGGVAVAATVASLTAIFVLPAVMALISRRRFLFWGLLPPLVLAVWVIPARCLLGQLGQVHKDFILIPVYLLESVVFVSGPISLIRHIRNRYKQKHSARLDAMRAQREAASLPQEGVWPPPPDYRQE